MAKRIDKVSKKLQNNKNDKNGTKNSPANPIFSSGNSLMVMVIVLLAIVTAVIVKATELQTLNDEQNATIDTFTWTGTVQSYI